LEEVRAVCRILEEVTAVCRIFDKWQQSAEYWRTETVVYKILEKVKGICEKFYDEKLKSSKSSRGKMYIFIYQLFKRAIKYLRINSNKRQVYW